MEAWIRLDKEQIVNLFKGCALNLKNYRSEDGDIHCFKDNQPCFAGSQLLQNQTDLLFDNNTNKNPFANLKISKSDIEEANVSFNLLDKDKEEDAFLCVD